MIVVTTDQRSDVWREARIGKLTGSVAGEMLAKIKTGEAAARRDLRLRLVCERLTGQSQEDAFVSKEMQRGIDREADAFMAYEALTGQLVRRVGFLAHDTLLAGCSPDGEVGGFAGIIELKCPKSATHLRYIRGKGVPSDHMPQILHNLWITGAGWADFVSFDDRFQPSLRLFVQRVRREDVDLAAYELVVRLFLSEVDRELEDVRELALAAA